MKESTNGMRPRHYSNQQLLAYLDDEVSGPTAKRIAEHLSCCWSCRAGMDDLEKDVQQLARLFAAPSAQDRWAARQAQSRFQDWCTEVNRKGNPVSQNTAPDFRRYWLALAAGLCLLTLYFASFRKHSVRPASNEVLAKLLKLERPAGESEGIVQQRYALAIRQDRPRVRYIRSELVVWAQPTEGRYSSRWSKGAGQLQYVVWRPARDSAFWYHPPGSRVIRESSHDRQVPLALADLADSGASLENIEARLGEWLRRRRCEPVSLAGEFNVFVDHPHTTVSVEKVGSEEKIVTLMAERATSRCKVTMVLQADIQTGRPLFETLAFSTADSDYRVDFRPQDSKLLAPGPETAALFRPDLSSKERPAVRKQTTAVRPTAAALIPEVDLLDAEIAARYILHQNEICLGHPVAIRRDKEAGVVRIEGLVDNAARRRNLKASFAALSGAELLSVHLQSPDELVSPQSIKRSIAQDTSGPQRTSMLINDYIDGLTASDKEKQLLKNQVIQSAGDYVSSGEALVREVAAFQSLADPGLESAPLSKKAAHLLEVMRRDHLGSMDEQLSRLSQSIGSVVRLSTPGGSDAEQSQRNLELKNLTATSRSAMMQARWMQEALLDLFSIGQLKAAGPDESASKLIESARALRKAVTQLQVDMISDTGRDGRADARIPREGHQ